MNPNSAIIHIYYSWYLTFKYRHNEAIAEAKQAQKFDPLSGFINTMLFATYIWAGRYERAIEELQITIAMNPNYFLAHLQLGHAYLGKLMIKEAIREYNKAVDLSGGTPDVVSRLAYAYYEIGKKEQAEKLIDSLKKRSKKEYVPPTCFFGYHILRGDLDQVYKWLKRAIVEHDSFLLWHIALPFDRYRIPDEPKFNELLKKVGMSRKGT
jgi:tetratricopeptide (TPR) repeat protein